MSTDEAIVRELKREVARLRPIVQAIAKLPPEKGLTPLELANLQYAAIHSLKEPEVQS